MRLKKTDLKMILQQNKQFIVVHKIYFFYAPFQFVSFHRTAWAGPVNKRLFFKRDGKRELIFTTRQARLGWQNRNKYSNVTS